MHGIDRDSLLACYDSIVPHAAALDGVRAKIARAEEHLKNVHLSIHGILATKEKKPGARHYYDPEAQELIVRMEKTTPLEPALPLVVGDSIHNARSALDHLESFSWPF
jgi:hypothetical protein